MCVAWKMNEVCKMCKVCQYDLSSKLYLLPGWKIGRVDKFSCFIKVHLDSGLKPHFLSVLQFCSGNYTNQPTNHIQQGKLEKWPETLTIKTSFHASLRLTIHLVIKTFCPLFTTNFITETLNPIKRRTVSCQRGWEHPLKTKLGGT